MQIQEGLAKAMLHRRIKYLKDLLERGEENCIKCNMTRAEFEIACHVRINEIENILDLLQLEDK